VTTTTCSSLCEENLVVTNNMILAEL